MTSGGNNFNDFRENQLTEFREPGLTWPHTWRIKGPTWRNGRDVSVAVHGCLCDARESINYYHSCLIGLAVLNSRLTGDASSDTDRQTRIARNRQYLCRAYIRRMQ